MSIVEAAGSQQIPVLHTFSPGPNTVRVPQDAGQQAAPAGPSGVQVTTMTPGMYQKLARLQMHDEGQYQAAVGIRSDGARTAQMDPLLMQMKQYLFRIIKNYPPYPPNEPERIKFLRSFNGLRQQIEQLIIPPDAQWFGKQPGQSASDQAPATPQVPFPALPDQAPDAAVAAAAAQVDAAAEAVAARRQELARQAAQMAQAQAQARAQELQQQGAEAADGLSESEAGGQSSEVGRQLAQFPQTGLSVDQGLLLQVVG